MCYRHKRNSPVQLAYSKQGGAFEPQPEALDSPYIADNTHFSEWRTDCDEKNVMRRVWVAVFILGVAGVSAWAQFPAPNVPPTTPPFFPPNASQSTAQNRPPNYPPAQNGVPVQSSAPDADSANHGVARLSMMAGGVQVAHGNMGELAGAVMNAPLLTEDRVLTDAGGRAEVQFDGANLIRVAGSSEVRMGDLQYKHYQVQIAQGLVTFRVLHDNDAQVEIST